jgi:replicative DNA helicase
MKRVELYNRMVARDTGIDSQKPRRGINGCLTMTCGGSPKRAASSASYPIVFEDNFGASMEGIHSAALGLQAERGQIGLVIVDYMQIANADDAGRRRREPNRVQEVGEISRGFKKISR